MKIAMRKEALERLAETLRIIAQAPVGSGGWFGLDGGVKVGWKNCESRSSIQILDGNRLAFPRLDESVITTELDISGLAISEEDAKNVWEVIDYIIRTYGNKCYEMDDDQVAWAIEGVLKVLGLHIDAP